MSSIKSIVYFNAQGFNHLLYKKGNKERERNVQMMRFTLLGEAYRLVGLTTTHQEYEAVVKNREVQYWGLIAIMEHKKIKVVLRQIGEGHIHFWSVIPEWVTSKERDKKLAMLKAKQPKAPL